MGAAIWLLPFYHFATSILPFSMESAADHDIYTSLNIPRQVTFAELLPLGGGNDP